MTELNTASTTYDVVIIGGGPGGLSAAVYASRAALKTLILESSLPGGQLLNTELVENYPSVVDIKGPDLAENLKNHALQFGAELKMLKALAIERTETGKFLISTRKEQYEASVVILSTGTSFNLLGVPGEKEYTAHGVSYCAICDGSFYRDKNIYVVGGGNSAVEEGIYLTNYGKTVTLLVRGDKIRAEKILLSRLEANPKITVRYNTSVTEFIGEGSGFRANLNSLKLRNNVTSEEMFEVDVDGVFIYVGMKPNTELVTEFDIQDTYGFIKTDEYMRTAIPGLYAVGDVRSGVLRQIITACNDGSVAGQHAYTYIEEQS